MVKNGAKEWKWNQKIHIILSFIRSTGGHLVMKRPFKSKTAFVSVVLILIFSSALADEQTDKVDKLFAPWDKPDSPGCALIVIQDGKIIYKKGYGMANLEHSVPITPQSVFYIGSVSKQFVSFCVALLFQQGKISLDDDIGKYVPALPDYGTPITIRHLIHHTSGLRDYLELEGIAGIPIGDYHEQDVIDLIARQKELNFKPGEQYLYSNSGYFLLAVIVKKAAGKSLRQFADENIFKPLGMKNSHFHDDYRRLIKNRAAGYFPAGKGKFRNFVSTFDCVGSGGLFTSVEDLFHWDRNFYHQKVGGKEVFELMHTQGKLNSGQKLDYAFALVIGDYKGLKTVGHGGALGGYRSALLRFPEQQFSVICLSNLSRFNPMGMARRVADIYLEDRFKQEPKSEAGLKSEPQYIKLSEKKLKEKVGAYIDRKTDATRVVSLRDGRLIIGALGRTFPLEPVSETEFHIVEAPIQAMIKFEEQRGDKPLLLHVYSEGNKPETYEAFEWVKPSLEQLREYEGDYLSQELRVTFKIAIKKAKLHFIHRNAPVPPLRPTLQDKFAVGRFKIQFSRDEENKISGFRLDVGRVKNLRFERN